MLSAVHLAILVGLGTHATRFSQIPALILTLQFNVQTMVTNTLITDLAEKADYYLIWIGLRCPDTNAKNCSWADCQGAPDQYDAFHPSEPSGLGKCVSIYHGQWFTEHCDSKFGFACELEAKASCGDYDNYGGYCYKAYNQPLSQNDAESQCQNECGHLVSIHSADENQMILDTYTGNVNYVRVGLQASGKTFVWSDNTTFDYNNIGYSSSTIGDCMALSAVDEVIPRGKWISVSCAQRLPFICKRESECYESTTPGATTPATLAPSTCDSPYFMDQNGTFYSPGFPNSYSNSKACYYILTIEQGEVVQLHFVNLQLSQGSSIELFNSITDSTPFLNITTNVPSSQYFTSTSNVMKMVFVAGNDAVGINRWEANFSPKENDVLIIESQKRTVLGSQNTAIMPQAVFRVPVPAPLQRRERTPINMEQSWNGAGTRRRDTF
ncbi:unnamed protein product [Cylicocyclus nassatus]|uniref:Uncharacterized protein n=1 Tax=Cylicocyclus nassatus TaxID=53992 RepID=A0AA36DS54_CYLNA|nr:unnamed protein product [Cylicocyclus nassatus]